MRKPLHIKGLFVLHNMALTAYSLVSFLFSARYFVEINQKYGIETVQYNDKRQVEDSLLYPWVVLFYLSKYYELLDSIFLVLMKKPVHFIGVWHHCTVLLFMSVR